MAYCQEEILPSLNTMDAVIIYPLSDLQELVKHIQKTITKRNHKLIDYDRYRLHLAKLQAKTEKTLNEEKSLLKVQAQHEIATQDYEYLNNLLKEQLPDFLILLKTLMESIFQSLYQLQEQIYRMIYARCDELVRANETHFVTYAMSVDEGYQWKKSQFDTPTEIQNMDIFKSGGKLSLQERASLKQQKIYGQHPSSLKPSYDIKQPSNIQQQSAVTPITVPIPVAHTSVINKSVSSSSIQYVLALYDYEAQAEGDLSFKKDDKIELIQRTSDTNDWWTGKLKGIIGIFPGTYVSII
ncbi:uncharacterized protein BX663DRAFT_444772 [Cokeromyces recurvatus]|uniref:uncharacterized protein n=1 Tax=Cokeromyces recurvatus TaxID=90255 RepID=UPI00221FACFB|nr:uncharacterized protein BX663DRAFT_444772 [Cokeromyces recurvatus]KAI7897588.1 hypothetical protein BX663DRAFT_444772 [Cokeromyces recurvatus]